VGILVVRGSRPTRTVCKASIHLRPRAVEGRVAAHPGADAADGAAGDDVDLPRQLSPLLRAEYVLDRDPVGVSAVLAATVTGVLAAAAGAATAATRRNSASRRMRVMQPWLRRAASHALPQTGQFGARDDPERSVASLMPPGEACGRACTPQSSPRSDSARRPLRE